MNLEHRFIYISQISIIMISVGLASLANYFESCRSKQLSAVLYGGQGPPIGFTREYIRIKHLRGADGIDASTFFHVLTLPIFVDSQALQQSFEAVISSDQFNEL